MLFGTNDFLDINPNNQNQSLISHSHNMTNCMRVLREGTTLPAEYFSYQFLTALGLAAPKVKLVKIEQAKEIKTYIDSEVITDFSQFQDRHLDKTTQTANTLQTNYRLDPSMYVVFLAELIMQDKDQNPGQYLIAKYQNRLYRLSIDKEMASTDLLPEDENILWSTIEKMRQNYYLHYESTLEQQFAFVHRLQDICSGNPSILYQIFFNSRVNATPELICYGFRDDLYAAWLKNAEKIIAAFKKRYPTEFNRFPLRESIREQVARRIRTQVTVDENKVFEFEKRLVDDLRSRLYFEDPSCIDESLLTNESQLQKILLFEKMQLLHLTKDKTQGEVATPAASLLPAYEATTASHPSQTNIPHESSRKKRKLSAVE